MVFSERKVVIKACDITAIEHDTVVTLIYSASLPSPHNTAATTTMNLGAGFKSTPSRDKPLDLAGQYLEQAVPMKTEIMVLLLIVIHVVRFK